MLDNSPQPIKAETILAPIGSLHAIATNVLDAMGATGENLRKLAMSQVAEAIQKGETMIPTSSIELCAKADTLPDLADSLRGLIAKIEKTLAADVVASPSEPAGRGRAKGATADVTASLDDALQD